MTTFGERLKAALVDAGFSQAEFAKAVGTYPCNMSQWINGAISPTVPSVRRILEALPGTDARWLLTGERNELTLLDLARAAGLDGEAFANAVNFSRGVKVLAAEPPDAPQSPRLRLVVIE